MLAKNTSIIFSITSTATPLHSTLAYFLDFPFSRAKLVLCWDFVDTLSSRFSKLNPKNLVGWREGFSCLPEEQGINIFFSWIPNILIERLNCFSHGVKSSLVRRQNHGLNLIKCSSGQFLCPFQGLVWNSLGIAAPCHQQINLFLVFVFFSGSIQSETRVFSVTFASSLRAPPTPSNHDPVYCFYDAQNQHILFCTAQKSIFTRLCV